MPLPPSSYELIRRAHRVCGGFNVRVRCAVAALPGNPGRVSVERFGDVWATRCELPDAPGWMNLLGPISAADLDVLDDALRWYGEIRPMIEVTPQPDHDRLARALASRGYAATSLLDILWASPPAATEDGNDAVQVHRVQPEESMLFARTLLGGHVDAFKDHEAEGLAALVGSETLTCYLATIDGVPAAGAILTLDDGLAYLANASCLPAFRNRGCHNALLSARLDDIAQLDCEFVVALAEVGSTSHRNMERRGLNTLVTATQWTFAAPEKA